MRCVRAILLLLCLTLSLRLAQAQSAPAPASATAPVAGATASAPAGVDVVLSTSVEEGKKQLVATVKKNGKLVEGATVSFGAKRLFGQLALGTDQTLDDGTAAIPFPSNLPGDANGELQFSATVTAPLSLSGARGEATMKGGLARPVMGEEFPRALWAPTAPIALIAVIALLLGGAWGAYLFVVLQLLVIRKGAAS